MKLWIHSLIICWSAILLFQSPATLADDAVKTVDLSIIYSAEKTTTYGKLPWKSGMTIADALSLAEKRKPALTYTRRGSGETAFLTQIGGVKNQGAFGPNWTYRVNGKLGNVSYALQELKPGDKVEWKFGKYKRD